MSSGANTAFLISETPAGFAQHMRRCIDEPALCPNLGESAASFMSEYMENQRQALRNFFQ